MKLQYMIIIFIMIALPVTLVLSAYNQFQIDTLVTQVSYDTKLIDATHDAAVALHTNIMNEESHSTIYNIMRENVYAANNVFSNSIATSFGVGGYTQEEIMSYVPAIVYTMYDGYYIYTPYTQFGTNSNERTLKPYSYYTREYKTDDGKTDIIVNYTLDNYIAIYGKINGDAISDAGYLIANANNIEIADDKSFVKIKDKDVTIYPEDVELFKRNTLDENINIKTIELEESQKDTYSKAAIQYYIEARDFTERITTKLGSLVEQEKFEVFNIGVNNDPEDETSLFNRERQDAIRESIITNLQTSIANYDWNAGGTFEYRLPVLSEKDWQIVFNNFSVISYLQGLPIGFKMYNSYSVCPLASNSFYVNPDDIYYVDSTNDNSSYYHSKDCDDIADSANIVGYAGYNFTKIGKDVNINDKILTKYFYRKSNPACYYCVINKRNKTASNEKIEKYNIAYYTAIARERQLTYKVSKQITDMINNP